MSASALSAVMGGLDGDAWDPIASLNGLFPTRDSLCGLAPASAELDRALAQADAAVNQGIRQAARDGARSQALVGASASALADLEGRAARLRAQAADTERVIEGVCGAIKTYDGAKRNLTQSIRALKRLQMASAALAELRLLAAQRNYGQCADRILALATLLGAFADFGRNPVLDGIRGAFAELQREVRARLAGEFDAKLFGRAVDPSVAPAFRAVDAFGAEYRAEVIAMFCSRFLDGYQAQFAAAPLGELDRRMNWLKQRIEYFNLEFAPVFPPAWRVPYFLSRDFCELTCLQIRELLDRRRPSVREFQAGFEQVAKFERRLAESFGEERANDAGERVWQPASEFIGMIGQSFARHTALYLAGEKDRLEMLCRRAVKHITEKKSGLIDSDNRLLKSGVGLVQHIKVSIERCREFSVGSALYDLFFILKEAIQNYIRAIESTIPVRITSDGEIRLICAITNTTQYFFSIIDGLARRVAKLVSEDQQLGVKVDDLQDVLQDAIRKQLKRLSTLICDLTAPILEQIAGGAWQTCPEAAFVWPANLTTQLTRIFTIEKRWLCDDNFKNMRSVFVPEWVQRFFDAAFRVRHLSNDGSERLSQASARIREFFTESLVKPTANEPTAEVDRKVIAKEFERIDNGLKVIMSPENVMTQLYIQLFPAPTKEQFMLLVRARGVAQPLEEKLEAAFISMVSPVPPRKKRE